MTGKSDTDRIGIIVVHGVGAQDPGQTLDKLLVGLERVDPGLAVDRARAGETVHVGGRPVRFYEVYWAELLRGQKTHGSARMANLQTLAWFPWFNWRRGNYRRGDYSVFKLAWWIVALPVVNFFIFLAYQGASTFAEVVDRLKSGKKDDSIDSEKTVRGVLRKLGGHSNRYTIVDEVLDEYLGDVFNYVNSAAGVFDGKGQETLAGVEVRDVYDVIIERFHHSLRQAHDDGCSAIHVVAHSLGSVISYHALTGYTAKERSQSDVKALERARNKVSRLYTIGSPLEKIRFFWPKLVLDTLPPSKTPIHWDNFASRLDPVAGVLHHFDHWGEVTNHALLGGGFIRGHVVYERSPVFLNALTQGICDRSLIAERSLRQRVKDIALLTGETLLTPVAVAILLAVGAMVLGIAVLSVPFFASIPLRPFIEATTLGRLQDKVSLVILVLMVIVFILAPSRRASKAHLRHWSKTPPSDSEPS